MAAGITSVIALGCAGGDEMLRRLVGWVLRRGHCPAARSVAYAEGGEAGQVDRGGQQPPVLGDPQPALHPGASATMAAAQQMGQLALHRGPVGAVVGPPGRVLLP